MKKNEWIVLNLQLLVGVIYSYDYFHRHMIVDHVLLFSLSIFTLSNAVFFLLRKIKLFSLRAFISILLSSFFLTITFIAFNRGSFQFEAPDLLLILLYLILRLLLYITTPLAVIFEVYLNFKNTSSVPK